MSFTATIEEDENFSIYKLLIGEFGDDLRCFVINREELWELKQQVDKAWFNRMEVVE